MSDLLSLAAINVTVTLALAGVLWRQIAALTRTVSDVDRHVSDVDRRLAQLEGSYPRLARHQAPRRLAAHSALPEFTFARANTT